MKRLAAICLALLWAFPAYAKKDPPFARVILLDGKVLLDDRAVDLGQALPAKGVLKCEANSSVHLALSGGASVILEADSILHLEGFLQKRGRAGVFSDDEIRVGASGDSLVRVKANGKLILSSLEGSIALEVIEGGATFWIGKRDIPYEVKKLQRARVADRRLFQANNLSKREAGELIRHWQRSIQIHGQREQLLKHYLKN